jgi:hypothetical protein
MTSLAPYIFIGWGVVFAALLVWLLIDVWRQSRLVRERERCEARVLDEFSAVVFDWPGDDLERARMRRERRQNGSAA